MGLQTHVRPFLKPILAYFDQKSLILRLLTLILQKTSWNVEFYRRAARAP